MILKAFSLLDTKVSAFHTPFFMAHVGHAIRACSELGADLSTTVGRHPADFHLYEIGTYDDQSGILTALYPIVSHGPVLAFVPKQGQTGLMLEQGGGDLVIPTPPSRNGDARIRDTAPIANRLGE